MHERIKLAATFELLAEAPDLLEALKALVDAVTSLPAHTQTHALYAAYSKGRSAITNLERRMGA